MKEFSLILGDCEVLRASIINLAFLTDKRTEVQRASVIVQGQSLCVWPKSKTIFIQLQINGDPLQYSCLENTMNGGAW